MRDDIENLTWNMWKCSIFLFYSLFSIFFLSLPFHLYSSVQLSLSLSLSLSSLSFSSCNSFFLSVSLNEEELFLNSRLSNNQISPFASSREYFSFLCQSLTSPHPSLPHSFVFPISFIFLSRFFILLFVILQHRSTLI